MKPIIVYFFFLSSLLCFSQHAVSQKWIKISKTDYVIQSPSDWSIDSSKQMGTALVLFSMLENTTDQFRENVNVLIQNIAGKNIDLAKYTTISTGQIKAMAPDAAIQESTTIKKGNNTWQKIIYTATQGNFKLKFEQYYFVTSQKAYVVTFTAEANKFDAFKAEAEQILNSFTPSPPTRLR